MDARHLHDGVKSYFLELVTSPQHRDKTDEAKAQEMARMVMEMVKVVDMGRGRLRPRPLDLRDAL